MHQKSIDFELGEGQRQSCPSARAGGPALSPPSGGLLKALDTCDCDVIGGLLLDLPLLSSY